MAGVCGKLVPDDAPPPVSVPKRALRGAQFFISFDFLENIITRSRSEIQLRKDANANANGKKGSLLVCLPFCLLLWLLLSQIQVYSF